jgi:hypothetical protein
MMRLIASCVWLIAATSLSVYVTATWKTSDADGAAPGKKTGAIQRLKTAHLARKRSSTLDNGSIDFDSTASISRPETGFGMHRPRSRINETKTLSAAHQESESYVLIFVHKNMVLLKSAHGLYTAKLGTALPGAGHVLSIERRGQKWVLLTERTVIAETN